MTSMSDKKVPLILDSKTSKDTGCHADLIHRKFEQIADKDPHATALHDEGTSITYRTLNERANQLAHLLQSKGSKPNQLVAVYMERSINLIVAILGVLKSGSAYLPIDRTYPSDRIKFMIKDASVSLIITEKHLQTKLKYIEGADFICLDSNDISNNSSLIENPDTKNAVSDLCYVIYTSGSTGQPKGVQISHHNVARLFDSTQQTFNFCQDDVWCLFHSYAFDFSVWEIFGALLFGGKLVIVPFDTTRSPKNFYKLLREERITILNQTPSAFRQLSAYEGTISNYDQLNLRYIIFGGEALDMKSLEPWFKRHGSKRPQLVNMYGITETTVHVSYHFLTEEDLTGGSIIGRPIADLQIYLLDEELKPVREGDAGEIYVAGAGLARGYLNRPELTNERFFNVELPNSKTTRLYRTGDLGRHLPNADYEHLGRIDSQIQLRGFRIELGEIESVLLDFEAVNDARVIMREDNPGDQRLAAYLISKYGINLSIDDLIEGITRKLPSYMIPGSFDVIESFPLTINGKLDIQALPKPSYERDHNLKNFELPDSPTERTLASIWKDILGVAEIGKHDGFISLGGHSLMAFQLQNSIERTFGVHLSITDILSNYSLETLSETITRESKNRIEINEPQELIQVDRNAPLPLSPVQEHILLETLRAPEVPAYNEVSTIHLLCAIDPETLKKSLNILVKRHEIFRTTYLWKDGILEQKIHKNASVELLQRDFRNSDDESREKDAEKFASEWSRIPFNIESPPLIRALLGIHSDDDFRLYLVIHHLATDAITSFDIVVNELQTIYEALTRSEEPLLPELRIQYADFAFWKNRLLAKKHTSRDLVYWKNKLQNFQAFEFPSDYTRPSSLSYEGARIRVKFPRELTSRIEAISNSLGKTQFVILLSAFKALSFKATQQQDIVVGSVSSDRGHSSIRNTAGCFLNYLPLRTKLDPSFTFHELTDAVQKTVYGAIEHRDISLIQLQEAIDLPRDASTHPFYQVLFILEPPRQEKADQWKVNQLEFHTGTSKLDVQFVIEQIGDDIFGRIDYNTALYSPTTVERLVEQYQLLLSQAITDPSIQIKDLSILSQREKEKVLRTFNNTEKATDERLRLHDHLGYFTSNTPDATALEFEDKSVSYRMLGEFSDNIALTLQHCGTKPDQVIAVIARRSSWLPIALFGVLKSGAAYLPIDPDQPIDRIHYLLEDSGAEIALIDDQLELPIHSPNLILKIEETARRNIPGEIEDRVKPENLAYLIYTSGSTGKPKGAMIEHRSICNRLEWMTANYSFSNSDVQLLKTPITFDVSVHELFLWSFVGAKLCISPPRAEKDPAALVSLIKAHQVNHIHFVPSMLDGFLSYVSAFEIQDSLKSLRNVYCSGEALTKSVVTEFKSLIGSPFQVGLHNLYGPTEAAVDVTYFDCSQLDDHPYVPIGRPVWNTQIYILDKHLNPLPVGFTGDLYIGGIQVGRGYINRDELTEKVFIQDPFSSATDAKLYKTGDEARWLPDGNIEYLGRSDFQVKIRGIRIELGEIETSIREFPGVTGAVVIATKAGNDTTLTGYYTCDSRLGSKANTDLPDFLRRNLPDQLIPHHLVELPEFPLTTSGKLDRKALPEPTLVTSSSEEKVALPHLASPTEELTYSIWCEILGIPSAHGSTGFFELGGHSLLAIKLLGRLRSSLGISLTLPEFLKEPNFNGLLDTISNSTTHNASIAKRNTSSPLPLSWGQRRMWYLHEIDDSKKGFVIAYGLLLNGFVDIERLETSITKLVETHEGLRTVFKNLENQLVQELLPDPLDPSTYISKENVSGESNEELCKGILNEEWGRKFELEKGPLFHARITTFSNDTSFVTFAFHHIIADEAIEEIVYRGIEAYYREDTSAVFEPQLQIGDYSLWERSESFASRQPTHVSWWKDYLHDAPTELNLPYDFPKTTVLSFRGKRVTASLNQSSSEKFRQLMRNSDATQFMGFQVAWSLFLGELCQVEDLVIGAPVSLRNQPDLEYTIGFLINSLPFRTSYSKQDSFSGLINKNRKQIIEAYTHAELPFDQLVDKLNVNRSQSASPIFQVMLVMNGQPSPGPRFGQVEAQVLRTDPDSAKFDLTLFVNDRDNGFELKLEYRNDVFLAETIEGWLECFINFLETLSEQPNVSISEIPLVNNSTKARQLSWAQGNPVLPRTPSTLPNLIEKASDKFNSRTAIQYKSKSLSYGELQHYASSLSTVIERPDIQNRKIGVCFDKTPELFVCLQAIMINRAAYVPLDVDWPNSRLAWVIEDSDIDLILVQKGRHSSTIRDISKGIEVLEIDLDSLSDAAKENQTSDCRTASTDVAYIIYTSGSTGRPKGVLVNQGNVVSSTLARNAFYGSYPERFLLLSPPIFDSSVAGIFWTLTQGGTLVLPDFGIEKDPQQLSQLLVQESITHFLCLPSVLDGLLEFLDGKENALTTVIVAGETCSTYLPKKFRSILPNARLYNEYGPTEGTVWCSAGEITHSDNETRRVSIGKPIPNSRLYITGKDQKLLPTGALGEIIIAGEGLTEGYHKLPDLTKERFLQPESPDINEPRIYRTGDLGKWRHDGCLEFHGRIDEQVKIRGYRIEPGEIESTIRDLDSVTEAAVIVKSYGPNDQRLVAFVTANKGITAKEVRESLIDSLPSYMVPSHIEVGTSIPYTTSGKVDRKQLSQYSLSTPSKADSSSKELINDPIAEKLIRIWKKVLSTQEIGPDDDFFQIGGHSFLAVRLFSQVREVFDVQLPVASLINAPTVRLQTKEIRVHKESKITASNFVPIKAGSLKAPLFCIHARDGGVLMYRDIAENISDIPIIGVESSWQVTGVSKEPSVEEMAEEYLPGILELTPDDQPVNLCGFSSGGLIAFELARMLDQIGRKTGSISMIDTFNPGNPPRRMSVKERWARRLRFEENQSIAKRGVMIFQLLFRTSVSVLSGLREPAAATLAKLWRMTGTEVPIQLKTYEAREATVDASLRYRPEALDLPITLFRGLDTDDGYERMDDLGWKSVCGEHLSIIKVPWDHGNIIHDDSAGRIAAHLEELLKLTSVSD